jgi:2-polyprenyl-3-methyl-5-hydroxy-6-metoxy-1,4-benzoquinol methylase
VRRLADYEKVIEGNIAVHEKEADYYDVIHTEIWNRSEQKRLQNLLQTLTAQVENQSFKALDFGAGTGNITQKLLKIGYTVTAIDISPEMCEKLKEKEQRMIGLNRLKVLNVNFDKTPLTEQFDLITGYSVIHHLPNYLQTLEKLAELVKPGGILYFDHEAPPETHPSYGTLDKLVLKSYYYTEKQTTAAYMKLHRIKIPAINYSLADVHTQLNWQGITEMLYQKGFTVEIKPHFVNDSRFKNPFSYLRKRILKANSAMLIAKKTALA